MAGLDTGAVFLTFPGGDSTTTGATGKTAPTGTVVGGVSKDATKTSAPPLTERTITGAERVAFVRWRQNSLGGVLSGAADPMTVPIELYRRFRSAMLRASALASHFEAVNVEPLERLRITQYWRAFDPDGLGAWDRTVSAGVPATWISYRTSAGVERGPSVFPRGIVSHVQLEISRHGWPDARTKTPDARSWDRAIGKGLPVTIDPRLVKAALGPAVTKRPAETGFAPGIIAPLFPPSDEPRPESPLPSGQSAPPTGFTFEEGAVVEEPGGIAALLTPRNLLIGGGIAVGLYLLLRRK